MLSSGLDLGGGYRRPLATIGAAPRERFRDRAPGVKGVTIATILGILLAEGMLLPLAWKWELGLLRVGIGVAVLGVLAAIGVSLLATAAAIPAALQTILVFLVTVAASAAVLAYRFYRDPERTAPGAPGSIVSPADGTVIYAHRAEGGVLPDGTKRGTPHRLEELTGTAFEADDALVVGIAMSFLDVHVNRAPIAGRIVLQHHIPGRFASLKDRDMVFQNERRTTVIQQPALQVAVVQIASRLVRQVVSFVQSGDEVQAGQRIGVIRLGSQVDLVMPASATLRVGVGDHVRAGETIIATSAPESVPVGS
jgi:phosphatidylserine decarboxylase